jgi:hypothetical protein
LVCGNPTWLEMPPYSMMNPAKKTSIYSGFSSQGGFPEGLWRPFSLDLGRFVELNRDDSWNLLDLFVECDLLDYIQHFFFCDTHRSPWWVLSRYYRCENVSWISVVSGQWWGSQLGRFGGGGWMQTLWQVSNGNIHILMEVYRCL